MGWWVDSLLSCTLFLDRRALYSLVAASLVSLSIGQKFHWLTWQLSSLSEYRAGHHRLPRMRNARANRRRPEVFHRPRGEPQEYGDSFFYLPPVGTWGQLDLGTEREGTTRGLRQRLTTDCEKKTSSCFPSTILRDTFTSSWTRSCLLRMRSTFAGRYYIACCRYGGIWINEHLFGTRGTPRGNADGSLRMTTWIHCIWRLPSSSSMAEGMSPLLR